MYKMTLFSVKTGCCICCNWLFVHKSVFSLQHKVEFPFQLKWSREFWMLRSAKKVFPWHFCSLRLNRYVWKTTSCEHKNFFAIFEVSFLKCRRFCLQSLIGLFRVDTILGLMETKKRAKTVLVFCCFSTLGVYFTYIVDYCVIDKQRPEVTKPTQKISEMFRKKCLYSKSIPLEGSSSS